MSELKEALINISEEKRNKIIPENIKSGVQIFNVVGNYEGQTGERFDAKINMDGITTFDTNNTFLNTTVESINLTDIDTSAVTTWSAAFYNHKKLKNLIGFKVGNATSMYWTFGNCAFKETPEMDTSGITDMSQLFSNNRKLKTVNQFDTSSVKTMTRMFTNCVALENLCVLNTSKVTDMTGILINCSSLTDESLNNFMQMCINAVNLYNKAVAYRRLSDMGLTAEQVTRCQSLPNYETLIAKGFVTGY